MSNGYDHFQTTTLEGKVKHRRKTNKKSFRTKADLTEDNAEAGGDEINTERRRTGSVDMMIKRKGSEPTGRYAHKPPDEANAELF